MLDFLDQALTSGQKIHPAELAIRLVVALLMGTVVAWIYRHTRKKSEVMASFPTTLVLLSVLIAMVTQVIGDNVARAFSLVGALSIVRFRTVVRNTQDTAYVIFAVVVGMAVGAHNLWVGVFGMVVIGMASFYRMNRGGSAATEVYQLRLRIGLGHEFEKLLGPTLDAHLLDRELLAVNTAKQGVSLDVTYQGRLHPKGSAEELVKSLNRIEGVQNAEFQRTGIDLD